MPVIVSVPVEPPAVKVTEQLPLIRVQLAELKVPRAGDCVQAIVPPGVLGVPRALSATVAVHIVPAPVFIELGEQDIVVMVDRRVIVTVVVAFAGALWLVSPP